MLTVDHQRCSVCGTCIGVCPVDALSLAEQALVIDHESCIECGVCIDECPDGALALDDRRQNARTA
jgi:NAD-dependent dihydropyrimidine dehydrogenase PreA subunit